MVQEGFKPDTSAPAAEMPMLEFRGKLAKYEAKATTYQPRNEGETERTTTRIEFSFTDVQPIRLKQNEVYPFPIALITINYADPQRSFGTDRWSHFTKSGRLLFGGNNPFDLDALIGKEQVWEQQEKTLRLPDENNKWTDQLSLCWVLKSVEGIQAGTANGASSDSLEELYAYMAGVADGKTEQEFYIALVAEQRVTSNPTVTKQITDHTLVDFMVSSERITRGPDGVLAAVV